MNCIRVSVISMKMCYLNLEVVGRSHSLKSAVITSHISEGMSMSSLTG